jgi:xanthine dehydrogenase accessory factor
MAVNERGEIVGAVSGGCVEGAVAAAAMEVLDSGEPRLLEYGIEDEEAWGVGLPCGGEIEIWLEPCASVPLERFAAASREGGRAALVTVIAAVDPSLRGARMLVAAGGERVGSLGAADLDAAGAAAAAELIWSERAECRDHGEVRFFVDVTAPPPRLLIVGAIDLAEQLCAVAGLAGWSPFVIDPRSPFATAERFPSAVEVLVSWPRRAFERLGPLDPATAVVALSHDPKLDEEALVAALESDACFVGAMGSRRAAARRRERLREGGVPEAALARISSPLGLDLGASEPGPTAVSIVSELIAVRNGRSGGRLAGGHGSIHR